MKRLFTLGLVTVVLSSALLSACGGKDDQSQNNIGSINLDTLNVSGDGISVKNNRVTITSGGSFMASGTLNDGMIYIDSQSAVTLNLNGAAITNKNGPAIYVKNAEKAFIVLKNGANNTLTSGDDYSDEFDDKEAVIFSKSDLEISGSGSLSISAGEGDGVSSENSILINDGKISVSCADGKAITGLGDVIVNGGDINVLNADEGIESKKNLTINDGNIFVSTTDDGFNGGPSKDSANDKNMMRSGNRGMPKELPANGERPEPREGADFPDGERPAPPPMDQMPQGGTSPVRTDMGGITINGGKITIHALGDGIDSNGYLEINGGEVTVEVPSSGGGEGALDSDSTITITGGTVICAGGKVIGDMRGGGTSETQSMLIASFSENQPAESTVIIKSSNGMEIAHFAPSTNFAQIGFSSKDVASGETYSVFVNSEKVQEITAEERLSVDRGPMTGPSNQ